MLGNVVLHVGWFNATLPEFLKQNDEPASFIHIDCDLYSSTKTVLDNLLERIVPGTVIVFDEYFNYPNWEKNEFAAFREFVRGRELGYKYLAYARNGPQVAVQIC